jgi:hybrid cluster-associated redox disulfide protein
MTPSNTIHELLAAYPAAARVLIGHRMHCVGCDVSPFETIADACGIYGMAAEDLFAEIERASAGLAVADGGGSERKLDEALDESFPASDPPANTVETGIRVGTMPAGAAHERHGRT